MLISMRAPGDELPTQRNLARRLGLTQSAVSQALKGSRRISSATRERVAAEARALGYLPDPALSALARRRWSRPRRAVIAWLGSHVEGRDRYLEAATATCRDLGLDLWFLPRGPEGDGGWMRALDRRRVAGVIVGQTTLLDRPRRLAWDRLRAVHCGLIVPPESGNVVCPDLPAAVPEAWRRVSALGHRRVAAILFADPRARSEQLLAGALLALARDVGDERRLRVWIGPRRGQAQAIAWLRSQPCDAVLGYDPDLADALRQAGVRRPYAAMVTLPDRPDVAGMELPFAAVAETSVRLLADRLRDPPGPPPQRRTHLIEMRWRDGASARPR